jgi:hypothetical protein
MEDARREGSKVMTTTSPRYSTRPGILRSPTVTRRSQMDTGTVARDVMIMGTGSVAMRTPTPEYGDADVNP